jgi:hypothetical protein
MKRSNWVARPALVLSALLSASVGYAVTPGQIDTFQDGTTMGWSMGANAPTAVTHVATGGPAGTGDGFIRVVADGSGPSGRMVFFNDDARWLGDYQAANITAIAMDLRNMSNTAMTIRVAFRDGTTSGAPTAISTLGLLLPANSAWTHAVFPVTAANLSFLNGATQSVLQSPVDIRILHVSTATYPGPFISASLGVDNIQAIPEPASVVLMLVGGLLVLGWATTRSRT